MQTDNLTKQQADQRLGQLDGMRPNLSLRASAERDCLLHSDLTGWKQYLDKRARRTAYENGPKQRKSMANRAERLANQNRKTK